MYNTICMDTDQEFKAVLAKKEARWEERIRELFDQTSREKAELQNQLAVVRNEVIKYELLIIRDEKGHILLIHCGS